MIQQSTLDLPLERLLRDCQEIEVVGILKNLFGQV